MLRPVWQGLGYDEKVGENYRLHPNYPKSVLEDKAQRVALS